MTEKNPMLNQGISPDELENLNATIPDQYSDELYESLNENERIIYHSLFDPISLSGADLYLNPLAATAGDPEMITVGGDQRYDITTSGYMQSKVIDARGRILNTNENELVIIDAGLTSIENEIIIQHSRQCYRNVESIKRLKLSFLHNPSLFDPNMSDVIYRVRSGEATSEERIFLLAKHPEMDSIEDMKFTCPLDIKTYERMMRLYLESLIELEYRSSIEYHPVPRNEQKMQIKNTSDTTGGHIAVIKAVIARVYVDGVVIELVERRSHYVFNSKPQLRGVVDNMAKAPDGKVYNTQPIAASAYFRIAKDFNLKEG